jgi:hypothetical protein
MAFQILRLHEKKVGVGEEYRNLRGETEFPDNATELTLAKGRRSLMTTTAGDDGVGFLVDSEEEAPALKGAFPFPSLETVPQKIVHLSSSAIRDSLSKALTIVAGALDEVNLDSRTFGLSDVKFSVAFDAKGEASIVSLAKGSLGAKTGIEVTLKRK